MPKHNQAFASVSLKEEDLELADKIARTFEVPVSRAAIVRKAIEFYAQHVGVEA